VRVTHVPTGRTYETVSSEAGLYAFPNLEVGPYIATVEQPGFKKLERSGLVIAISTRSVVDLQLEIGQVSETVQVAAEAPLLAKATAELGTAFEPKLMRDAPLFFGGGLRNPEAFIAFTPGATTARATAASMAETGGARNCWWTAPA
jgi:Carboxypeptidase regulatory-like domain